MSRWDDVNSLLSVLSQLGIAKGHLFRAGRELLLLFQTLIDVAGGCAEGLEPSRPVLTTKELLAQVRGVTAAILAKLPDGDEKKTQEMREAIFQSILGVLGVEIGRLSRSSSSKARLKREALEAIVATLQKEAGGKKGKVQNAAA
ncbi:MAG: hypothetical protein HYY44_01540 [Deltaproteobacteria bacterium]|nr:hypothetical protein [Deltaproteobacteria bacterium]MBI4374789.1 hypothetical protein [Deltaproteobacteria bacterium]